MTEAELYEKRDQWLRESQGAYWHGLSVTGNHWVELRWYANGRACSLATMKRTFNEALQALLEHQPIWQGLSHGSPSDPPFHHIL